jgi:hypothetical protein
MEKVDDTTVLVRNTAVIYMSIEHARLFIEKAQQSIAAWDAMNAQAPKA